jgi:hypothetical protein
LYEVKRKEGRREGGKEGKKGGRKVKNKMGGGGRRRRLRLNKTSEDITWEQRKD